MANPTLIDVATRTDANGKIPKIVELLNLTNEVIDDAVWVECNEGSSHKTTIRTGLPTPTWRQLNYGVQPTKSTTAQVKDACGMMEDYAEVDKALADLNGNTSEFRLSEDMPHLEAMNETFTSTLFYGNTTVNPERFMGLAPRFNAKSTSTSKTGYNVLDGGGSSSTNSSVWLVVWGESTVHCLYPRGSAAGLQMRDLGEHTLFDANNGRYQGYRTHYKWDCGLTVKDWRYVVRIANIDVAQLTKNAGTGADLIDLMVQAIELVPNVNMGKAAFYCSRTVRSFLRRQITNKSNTHLLLDQYAGKHVVTFDDIPCRRVDGILNTEAQVS